MSIAEKLLTIANNTPAVGEVLNVSKVTATGTIIRVDDMLTGSPLQVQTGAGAEVKVYGKNLVDYTKATGRTAAQKVEIVDDGVVWQAGGNYYFIIPLSLPAGVTVRGSYTASTNEAGEYIQYMRLIYEDGTMVNLSGSSGNSTSTVITTQAVKAIYFYKYTPGTALTQDLLISNIQLEIGEKTTAYEAYKTPQNATADAGGKVSGLVPVYPTMTIVGGEAVECTYFPTSAADVYYNCQQIRQQLIDLRESIKTA